MSIAGLHDYNHHNHGSALLLGTRGRHMRTLAIAGVLLVLVWVIKQTPLFHQHVSSSWLPFPFCPALCQSVSQSVSVC